MNTRQGSFWMWTATALVVGSALYIGYQAASPCIDPQVIVQLTAPNDHLCLPQAFATAVERATSIVAAVLLVLTMFATALRAINRHHEERFESDVDDTRGGIEFLGERIGRWHRSTMRMTQSGDG